MWNTMYSTINEFKPDNAIANWGANTQNAGAGGPGTAVNVPDANASTDLGVNRAGSAPGLAHVWGYIATNFGAQGAGYTAADIETQMTQWHTWYGVTKFFLDQVPPQASFESFYSGLETWAKAHIASTSAVALNMGVYPANADIAGWVGISSQNGGVLFDWENSTAPTAPPSNVFNFPAADFVQNINGLDSAGGTDPDQMDCQLPSAVSALEQAHAGGGFLTNDNTYQTPPSMWDWYLAAQLMKSVVTSWSFAAIPFDCTFGAS
jgi:hypothetical protein